MFGLTLLSGPTYDHRASAHFSIDVGVAGLTVVSSGDCERAGRPQYKHEGVAATRSAEAPMSVLFLLPGWFGSRTRSGPALAGEARRAGVEVAGIAAVAVVPKKREVRYLRKGDAAEGERLASRFRSVGKPWQVREPGSGTT